MKLYSNFSIVIAAVIALSCVSCAPMDPRAELQEAHALMQKKQFDAALPRTRSCLDINHENVDAIVANALCVYNMTPRDLNECKNAKLNLSRATSTLSPDRFDAWYAYTWVLMQEQDYDNALNAARRARNLFRMQQKPPVPISEACDESDAALHSGLVVDAMGGMPGIYSARYMGHDTPYSIKNAAIIREAMKVPEEERTARYFCAIACVFPDGRELLSEAAF